MASFVKPARLQATHAVVNNAPWVISVFADYPVLLQRTFTGPGAPSATTLDPSNSGNGMYNGVTTGYVVDVALGIDGVGRLLNKPSGVVYAAGQILTVDNIGNCQITIDTVSATGDILTFHVSKVGSYTNAYPGSPIFTDAGGAVFDLSYPLADFYIDTGANNLYRCSQAGNNNVGGGGGSAWVQISGSGGGSNFCGEYDPSRTYSLQNIVIISAGSNAGTYCYINNTPSAGNAPYAGGNFWVQFPGSSTLGVWM